MSSLSLLEVGSVLLCASALGGMAFFAAVFAPLVFRRLPAEIAGSFLRAVFPVYYGVLLAMTTAAALLAWGRPEAPVLAAVAVLFAFARWGLLPRINRARDAGLAGDEGEAETFARLHRLSVLVNAAQMAALLAVFLRFAGV